MDGDDLDLHVSHESNDECEIPAANQPPQDSSYVTPEKKNGSEFTPRRSPRVPKPRAFPGHFTADQSNGGADSPVVVPNSPSTPNRSKATSTPMTTREESDVETLASPILEALSSNDSFIAPSSISKVLQITPRKTPNKKQPHGSGASPKKSETWLSPYKSHRPKYLPKNINLVKKKRMERIAFIEKAEEFDARLEKLPAAFASPKRPVNPIPPNDGDILGTMSDLYVIFHPGNFFSIFDENKFDSHFGVNMAETIRSMKLSPHLATAEDCRALALFLTVTSDPFITLHMSTYLEDHLEIGTYFLDWADLKIMLSNLGLTKKHLMFDSNAYYKLDVPKSPMPWNFEVVFMTIRYSFRHYSKMRLMRLSKFLSDCLYEPVLLEFHPVVVSFLRSVLEHLILNGVTPKELSDPLDHMYYSCVSNRVIIQSISSSPVLKPVADIMAYRTIHGILGVEYAEDRSSLSQISIMLTDIQRIRSTTGMKDIYQLIIICEYLVAQMPVPFNAETKTFLEKLADFAEHMSFGYSYFQNLFFTDTVTRLRSLCSISSI